MNERNYASRDVNNPLAEMNAKKKFDDVERKALLRQAIVILACLDPEASVEAVRKQAERVVELYIE